MPSRTPALLFSLLTWLVCALPARAQPAALGDSEVSRDPAYQRLIDAGLSAFREQRYRSARDSFVQAHALEPSARTWRALGMTDLALDAYAAARSELQAALVDRVKPLTPEQRTEAEELLSWMASSLRPVRLELEPRDASATIDAKTVRPGDGEVLLEPGTHELLVTARGRQPHTQRFEVSAGQNVLPLRVRLTIEIIPEAPAQSSSQTWIWLGASGAAAVVGGGILFALGRVDVDHVEDASYPQSIAQAESARSRGLWLTASGVGLGALGLVGLTSAVILWPGWTQRERAATAWNCQLTPGHITVTRRFW